MFTQDDIELFFSTQSFSRGRRYYLDERVFRCQYNPQDNTINAEVSGSYGSYYHVTVRVEPIGIKTTCTCPVAKQCKHGAATLLEAVNLEIFNNLLEPEEVKGKPFQTWLQELDNKQAKSEEVSFYSKSFIGYLLEVNENGLLQLKVYETKKVKTGEVGKGKLIKLTDLFNHKYGWSKGDYPTNALDEAVINNMALSRTMLGSAYPLGVDSCASLLFALAQTKRCSINSFENPVITRGEDKPLQMGWSPVAPYELSMSVENSNKNVLVFSNPPTYINMVDRTVGMAFSNVSPQVLDHLKELPPLDEEQAKQFVIWSQDHNLDIPMPYESSQIELKENLQPILKIAKYKRLYQASVIFNYGPVRFERFELEEKRSNFIEFENQIYHCHRQLPKEHEAIKVIKDLGFDMPYLSSADGYIYKSGSTEDWIDFFDLDQQSLLDAGWQIEFEDKTSAPVVHTIDNVTGEIEEDEFGEWFDLGLKVDIEGHDVDLVPMILDTLRQAHDWQALPKTVLLSDNQHFFKVDRDRLQPIINILQQLTEENGRISKRNAAVLNEIEYVDKWSGGQKTLELAEKLSTFNGIEPVDVPTGLDAQLRDYQQHGLNWLWFLAEYGFAGVLADDMGLGKTIQALALLQLCKQNNKLDDPAIVICPTSLVSNWRSETQRFTPDLKVLVLHGSDRKPLFEQIVEHDVIITTYPLIQRDFTLLEAQKFSWIILDEAQTIKNPRAKMTLTVKKLHAQNRLCLTGTPMENHLGELWSIYDFLMPGFLSNLKGFNDLYKKPIENGDSYALNWLKERINPFMLRRTKDQVAKELPEKTEIIRTIEMPKDQRMLYESIRAAMEKKVRDLLKTKGMAKSHIEFLDAMLKLRQVCCDPKLVKLEQAASVKSSAKLEYLMETLPEMIEEGRKILIFSQFAQMLQVIEEKFKEAGIGYSKLTGQTKKRGEAIDAFQNGDVPVFLISLKAGGVGLNLTAADTVIHYDPWWNPAAESQATDRAYRIGQDKPVFVYKFITEDTIEEKVLELQAKKRILANAMVEKGESQEMGKLDADQLLGLFSSGQ